MSIQIKKSKRAISYNYAMKFLKKRVEEIKRESAEELIWILEHPITYTSGIRSKKSEILDKKIRIIKTNRGGKITLHNPGQKIIYFVIDLNKRKKDIRKLINIIEKSIIEFLKEYKINSSADKKNIGIWVKNKKIAAIGLKVTRWVAYHGFSINVNNNLNDYKKIIPCGLSNNRVTSMTNELGKFKINIDNILIKIFIKNINKL